MERRVYTGWKAGLTVVFAVVVAVVVLNLFVQRFRSEPAPGPGKVVTTVPPAG